MTAKPKPSGMTEAMLQTNILELARLHHLQVFHCYDSRKSTGPGFPDLVLAGPGGVVYAELKNDTLQPTPEQMTWLGMPDAGGAEAYLWRPAQWQDETIHAVLARLAKPRQVAS
jgi:hypothetical protein